jgi:5-formyltetrahydrofolate cyclo-ligase
MTENALQKQLVREKLPESDLLFSHFGKLAEQVRRIDNYRNCKQIFVAPAKALGQIRINTLLDQKELIMPSGGLKRGFVRFRPNTIPFNKLGHAVSFKGMEKFGDILSSTDLASLKIDLFLVDSEVVGCEGGRLGDGLGFTDLAIALLAEYGAAAQNRQIFSIAAENRVLSDPLPRDPWDITLDGVVTTARINYFTPNNGAPLNISWSDLPKKKIKKIQPLWDLFRKLNPLPEG